MSKNEQQLKIFFKFCFNKMHKIGQIQFFLWDTRLTFSIYERQKTFSGNAVKDVQARSKKTKIA